jgi:hypothetical protein
MIAPDREQLKRDCADAMEALLQEQNVTEIPRLSDDIRTLGPTYRAHGERCGRRCMTGPTTRSPGT